MLIKEALKSLLCCNHKRIYSAPELYRKTAVIFLD